MEVKKVDGRTELLSNEQELKTVARNEENLQELLSNPVREEKTLETKSIEKTDTDNKNFVSEHPIISIAGGLFLGLLVYSVGRNPKNLAKVLKGTSKAVNPKYAEAEKIVDDVIAKAKSGEDELLKSFYETAMKLFKKPQYRCEMSENIAKLEERIVKRNIPKGELTESIDLLKNKLDSYLDDIEKKLLSGANAEFYIEAENFYNTNKGLIDKIQKLADEQQILSYFSKYQASFNPYIRSCPKEFLSADGIYFHGTKRAGGIYKNGINPFGSNQGAIRELGAGIYTTPDVRVAGGFSSFHGTILPLKLDKSANIAYVDELSHSCVGDHARTVLLQYYKLKNGDFERATEILMNSPLVESMMRRLFVEAGYDAAYMHKGMKVGLLSCFVPDVNKVIGRPQSQLVVFNGEKLEILERNLAQRIGDVGSKFATFGNMTKYGWNLSMKINKWIYELFIDSLKASFVKPKAV